MTTLGSLADEVLSIVKGYGLYQPRATYLTAPLASDGLTVTVRDASAIDQGTAELGGSELVLIESVDRTTKVVTLAPDGRGNLGTTAVAHAADARLDFNPPWPKQRVRQVINDTIVSTFPTLFGVATAQFTFTPSVWTYELPADAERVLSVSADTIGPSRDQQFVRRFTFNSVAPVDDWATTNTITLHEPVSPGRTVTVTYMKQPSALEADSDLFTASGLRETAKQAIIFGTCSTLLAFMDMARLPTDSAQADEYDERNAVGTAARISNQLYARFQLEVDAERRRLRATTPATITQRIR